MYSIFRILNGKTDTTLDLRYFELQLANRVLYLGECYILFVELALNFSEDPSLVTFGCCPRLNEDRVIIADGMLIVAVVTT